MTASLLCVLLLQAAAGHPAAAMCAADSAFSRLDYPAALESYRSALAAAPDDPRVLWRLARLRVIQSEATEPGIDEPLLREAEQYARRAVRSDPRCAEARVWLAGTIGFLALTASAGEQIRLSHEIIAQTDTALALKPDDDVVYSIRGSFYHALGNIGWVKKNLASLFLGKVPAGGYEESESSLQKAVRLAPQVMRHQYELAILYLDWGKEKEAVELLRRAGQLPVLVASDVPRLKKIRSLLRDLE